MNKLTKTIGKIRSFMQSHAKVSERKDAAKWIDQVQELTTIEFNNTEVAYLHYFIKKLRNKKPHDVLEWTQLNLLEKLTSVAERLEQAHEETQQAKVFAQRVFCEGHGVLEVAPLNGYCPMCRNDVYSKMTVEEAGSHHVTFCPHCHHSFASTKKETYER